MTRVLLLSCLLLQLSAGLARAEDKQAADWPAFHAGGPLTGVASTDPGAPPMKTRWTYRTAEDHPAAVGGSPAIVGDTVYVADADGALHAIDLKTGKARWKYESEDG